MPFPIAPNDGDTYESANGSTYIYAAATNSWQQLTGAQSLGGFIGQQRFEVDGSYTPSVGTKKIVVELVGGGGGGGGCGTTAASQAADAAGGGGGGYSLKVIDVSALTVPETVTIGAGGNGGAAGNNIGLVGGTTSFGAHLQATGGSGGGGSVATTGNAVKEGGIGGVGSLGDINLSGGWGGNSAINSGNRTGQGKGGTSMFGQSRQSTVTSPAIGRPGLLYGGGGSGGNLGSTQTQVVGGDGADGFVLITEYT